MNDTEESSIALQLPAEGEYLGWKWKATASIFDYAASFSITKPDGSLFFTPVGQKNWQLRCRGYLSKYHAESNKEHFFTSVQERIESFIRYQVQLEFKDGN